jgi:hypothetical protein
MTSRSEADTPQPRLTHTSVPTTESQLDFPNQGKVANCILIIANGLTSASFGCVRGSVLKLDDRLEARQ